MQTTDGFRAVIESFSFVRENNAKLATVIDRERGRAWGMISGVGEEGEGCGKTRNIKRKVK